MKSVTKKREITPKVDKKQLKTQQFNQLVSLGQKCSKLWKTANGIVYADVSIGGNVITCRIESPQFYDWLQRKYYSETGLNCGKKMTSSAVSTLATVTQINGLEQKFFNRVGEAKGYYYLHLGTACGSVVRYSADGWEIIQSSPVQFSRSLNYSPLPLPSSDKDVGCGLEYFYELIGATKEYQPKLTEFLIKCLIPGSMEPSISFWGRCGTSSLRAAEAMKKMVDPAAINQINCVPSHTKLIPHLEMSRVVLYELFDCNDISSDEVDDIVRISRGKGFANGLSRPQIIAYTDSAKRHTLDHFIPVNSVKGGLFESELDYWAEFSVIHPEVLGALLDIVCDRLAATADQVCV
jgi:hypothetical protein